MALPVFMGILSMANANMATADANDQMEQKAADYGVRKAGIASATASRLDGIMSRAYAVEANAERAENLIEQDQAAAEAQARVNAAAAGVEGESVNQVIDETEVNAVKAKAAVKAETAEAQRQSRQDYVDTKVNADKSLGQLDTSTHNQTLRHTLAFAQGFMSGFEPAPGTEASDT